MPRRSRHRLSLLRLARGRAFLWPTWALAVLLLLSNAMAAVTPVRMISMATPVDMSATHLAMASMTVAAEPGATAGAMPHHYHAAMAGAEHSTAPAPRGNGCPCCDNGHCDCLQSCNPLPQIAAVFSAAPPLAVVVPAPLRVVAAISFADTPPIRPPIG